MTGRETEAGPAAFPLIAWLKDAATLVGGSGATLVASSLIAVVVARTLGPEAFGVFAACLGASYALAVLAQLGLATWLLRELTSGAAPSSSEANRKVVAAASLIALGSLALPVITAVVTTLIGTRSDVIGLAASLMLYAGCAATCVTLEAALRARRAVGAVARLNIIEKTLLLSAIGGWTATASHHLGFLGLAYVACGVIRLALTVLAVRKRGYAFERIGRADLVNAVRASAPFALAVSSMNITTRLDVILVGIVSATAAGYYGVSERFVALLIFAPIIASSALYPHLRHDSAADRSSPVRLLVILSAALTIPAALLARPIIALAFGAEFAPATHVMQIMLLSVPSVVLVNAWLPYLYQRHQERLVARVTTPIMVVGSGSIMLTTALSGPTGAAIAYAIRALLVAVTLKVILMRSSRVSDRPKQEPTGVPAVLPSE